MAYMSLTTFVARTVNRELLQQMKSGEVQVTDAGRTAASALWWGDMWPEDAIAMGYVEPAGKRAAEEADRVQEFVELVMAGEKENEAVKP